MYNLSSILKLVALYVMMFNYLMCCGYEAALLQMGQTAEENHKVVTHYCGLLKEERTHTNTPTHQLPLLYSLLLSFMSSHKYTYHYHLSVTFFISFTLTPVPRF